MPNTPELDAAIAGMITKVQNAKGAMTSAKTLIDTFTTRLQAALDAAESNGATIEELAPIQAEVDAMDAETQALAAAVAANP